MRHSVQSNPLKRRTHGPDSGHALMEQRQRAAGPRRPPRSSHSSRSVADKSCLEHLNTLYVWRCLPTVSGAGPQSHPLTTLAIPAENYYRRTRGTSPRSSSVRDCAQPRPRQSDWRSANGPRFCPRSCTRLTTQNVASKRPKSGGGRNCPVP